MPEDRAEHASPLASPPGTPSRQVAPGGRMGGPVGTPAAMGYLDVKKLSATDPTPYVPLEGLRNIQRLIKIQNPPIGNVKLEELIDNRPLKKLEDSGFLQKTYAAYGVAR